MTHSNKQLPLGYSNVAPGHVVSVVTCLEMLERPSSLPNARLPNGITLDALHRPDIAAYRALFRKIGADWLWCSRLIMSDDELGAILNDDHYEIFVVRSLRLGQQRRSTTPSKTGLARLGSASGRA